MGETATVLDPHEELFAALEDLTWTASGHCKTCLVNRGAEHRSYCVSGRAFKAALALRSSPTLAAPPAPKRREAKKTAPAAAPEQPGAEAGPRLRVLLSSASKEWGTPRWLFCLLHERHHFQRDVCATADNALLRAFWSPEDDALSQEWTAEGGPYWMNPPYGTFEAACDAETCRKKSCAKRGHHLEHDVPGIDAWMRKAREAALAGATVVCLVPARVDTHWWHETVWAPAGQLLGVSMRSRHLENSADHAETLKGFLQVIAWEELRVEVLYVRTRLRFAGAGGEESESAPFPSAIVTFSPPPEFP